MDCQQDSGRRGSEFNFFRGGLEAQLLGFDAVSASGQRRELELAILIGPACPGAAGSKMHEANRGAGNRDPLCRTDDSRRRRWRVRGRGFLRAYGCAECRK
jgi:hypothetical protein